MEEEKKFNIKTGKVNCNERYEPYPKNFQSLEDNVSGAAGTVKVCMVSRPPLTTFEQDLRRLINTYSMENQSNTPDNILAEYLVNCLDAFALATTQRERWYVDSPQFHPLSGKLEDPDEQRKVRIKRFLDESQASGTIFTLSEEMRLRTERVLLRFEHFLMDEEAKRISQ